VFSKRMHIAMKILSVRPSVTFIFHLDIDHSA